MRLIGPIEGVKKKKMSMWIFFCIFAFCKNE